MSSPEYGLEVDGSPEEVATEIYKMVKMIYRGLYTLDQEAADWFLDSIGNIPGDVINATKREERKNAEMREEGIIDFIAEKNRRSAKWKTT